MTWEFAKSGLDHDDIELGGVRVWEHEWKALRRRAQVKDPHYGQDFTFDVYEITDGGAAITFAAGEFSNGVWGFFLPAPAV